MKKIIILLVLGGFLGLPAFVLWPGKGSLVADSTNEELQIHFHPVFGGKNVRIDESLKSAAGDSLSLHTLRFYLSNFVFLKNRTVVFQAKNSQYLLDLEDEKTLVLKFMVPENVDYDQLQFNLGIDSLTNISGAMGGDLDPTKGMFWSWQSGYINVKMEGYAEKCPGRNHEFQFHLGGYMPPYQSCQLVSLSIPKDKILKVRLDLTPFFEQVDWTRKHSIMSPCREAAEFSRIMAKSFRVHAE